MWQAVGLALDLGWRIAVPLLVCVIGGIWLDEQLRVGPLFLLGGIFIGLVVSFYAIYQLASVKRQGPGTRGPGSG